MMTSINPKNSNLNNEGRMAPTTANSLFQMNNYDLDKGNNNAKMQVNTNFNMNNDKNINSPKLNEYNNNNSNNLSNMNMNYNNQNNSINLNAGLQGKKNYSTPILNEAVQGNNEDPNYNKSFDMYERNRQNNNMRNISQPQNLPPQNINSGNDNYYYSEMENLKKEIMNLRRNNENLNNQLKEEQRKKEQLLSIQKAKDEGENSILAEISNCLQVSSSEEILPKLNEIINYLNNNVKTNTQKKNQDNNSKIRDELISKLQNLYLSLTGSNEKKEEITIKILWRWIKHLINTVKQLALEKEKNTEIYQNMQEIDEYKEYCEELISEFNLQSLDELKIFIDNLLKQNNINMMPENENQQNDIRNIQMRQQRPMGQQQYQGPNYQQEEENEEGEAEQEGEIEGEGGEEGEGEGEGEEEIDENENIDPNQQQYENEGDYEENNEMMQQQMEINNQNNPHNNGNYNYKYEGNINQGNRY